MNDWRETFVEHLRQLHERDDRAALAILRRGLRGKPELNLEAARYVYPWLPANLYEEGVRNAFLIGSLFSLHPLPGGEETIGANLKKIKSKSESIERRLLAVVDADSDTIPTHLRHIVTLLKSQHVPIEWITLLKDISSWDHPEKWVQRKWVRDFYSVKEEAK